MNERVFREIEQYIVDADDVREILNREYIQLVVDSIIDSTVQVLLSSHPEFDTSLAISRVAEVFKNKDLITIDASFVDNRLTFSVNLIPEYDTILLDWFYEWEGVIETLRESLGVDYDFPIRNSFFFRYLFRSDKEFAINQRISLSEEGEAPFLYIIEHGNINAPWSVDYGGFSPVDYQGIPLGETIARRVEDFLNSNIAGRVNAAIESRMRRIRQRKVVVDKTEFLEQVLNSIDIETAYLIEQQLAEYLETGQWREMTIKYRNTIYEIIETSSGRFGLHFSLKYNRRRGKFE